MSILPLYLSSFSNVSPLQRGVAERLNSEQADRAENAQKTESARKNEREYDELVVRSGDIVSNDGDVFSLSTEAKNSVSQTALPLNAESPTSTETKGGSSSQTTQANGSAANTADELSDEERQQVSQLQQQDVEVKAHEAAHLAAAGGLVRGGASYEYQTGPDGKAYAVGGEVSIDTSSIEGDPEATIAKAQQVRNAALAPASPSSQDYKVAAKASQMEAQARQELSKDQQTTQDSTEPNTSQSTVRSENQKLQQSLHHLSQSAVAKYAVQSQAMTFRSQGVFQAIA